MIKQSLLILAISLAGCSTSNVRSYNTEPVSVKSLDANQAVAVFYRKADINGPAVNVYVNGDYQTSLLADAYSSVAVCADKQLFTTSFSSKNNFGNRTLGMEYTLPVGQIAYFKVIMDNSGKPVLTKVGPDIAAAEIATLPKMNQTLSRVKQMLRCGSPTTSTTSE